MSNSVFSKNPISLLRSAVNTLVTNPVILYPVLMIAFVEFLLLEILFFAPRYPLSLVLGPIISRLAGESYLHYPLNFLVMNKWFHALKIPLYIFISSYFLGVAIAIIHRINSDQPVNLKEIFREVRRAYLHLLVASVIIIGVVYGLSYLYEAILMKRALVIRSTKGIFFITKQVVLYGAPYVKLILTVFVTSLFAFVAPAIVIDKKKVFTAIFQNFKVLWGSFWFIFSVLIVPVLLYIPLLLLKTNSARLGEILVPEVLGILAIADVFFGLFIDAVHITAITMYYLWKKESQ